jgi:hypothetical protein
VEPTDADRWMREHGRATLRLPDPLEEPTRLRRTLLTDLPLPARFAGEAWLLFDDLEPVLLGPVLGERGERLALEDDVRLDALGALAQHLTPGEHRARVRFAPTSGPWRSPVTSNEVRLLVKPRSPKGGGGGGGGGEPPPPRPSESPPPPPPPAPAPVPDGVEEKPPQPPPDTGREEVVTPLVAPGAKVQKERAVVAVRDPEAGTKPPPPVPLERVLQDFDRIVERAVPEERWRPSDREFLLRYFEALRREAAGR